MSPKYEGNCLYCIHLLCKEGRIRGEVYVGHINVMPLDTIFNILCLYFLILFMAWYQYGRQDPLPLFVPPFPKGLYSTGSHLHTCGHRYSIKLLLLVYITMTVSYIVDVCMYPCNNFISFMFFHCRFYYLRCCLYCKDCILTIHVLYIVLTHVCLLSPIPGRVGPWEGLLIL